MEYKIVFVVLALTANTALSYTNNATITNKATTCDGNPTGLVCSSDCTSTVRCIAGNAIPVENCAASGQHCYKFTDGRAPICSIVSQCGGPIQCLEAGEFPDPDFCTKYHECPTSSGYSTVHDCARTAYNIATNKCELPVNHPEICGPNGPVPECTSRGEVGVLTMNPRYYFVCTQIGRVLYPGLRICKEELAYDVETKTCRDPSTFTTTTTTTLESTTATTTTAATTTETTTPTTTATTTTTPTTTITTPTTTATTTTTPTTTTTTATTTTVATTTPTTTATTTTPTTTTVSTTTSATTGTTTSTSTSEPTSTTTQATTTGTGTSSGSSSTSPPSTTDSTVTTQPPDVEPFDYTVTIAVGTTAVVVVVAGVFIGAVLYVKKRRMKMPESRKLF